MSAMIQKLPPPGISALLVELYDLSPAEVKQSRQFQLLQKPELDKSRLLASIPSTPGPSVRPMHLLYLFLTEIPGEWPTFDLIKCHTRLFKLLPEEVKAHEDGDSAWLVGATKELVKKSYASFSQFIGSGDEPALRATNADNYITYRGLNNFVRNFQLPIGSSKTKPVVAIALPNGPILAATCIAVTTYYTAAPINPAAGPEQFQADILQSRAKCILTTSDDYKKLGLDAQWVVENNIQIFLVNWAGGDDIYLTAVAGTEIPTNDTSPEPNNADDIGLILFTSGTSGTKKVVPLTTHSIIAGIVFVMESWGLTSQDICLNMMPLYHV